MSNKALSKEEHNKNVASTMRGNLLRRKQRLKELGENNKNKEHHSDEKQIHDTQQKQ